MKYFVLLAKYQTIHFCGLFKLCNNPSTLSAYSDKMPLYAIERIDSRICCSPEMQWYYLHFLSFRSKTIQYIWLVKCLVWMVWQTARLSTCLDHSDKMSLHAIGIEFQWFLISDLLFTWNVIRLPCLPSGRDRVIIWRHANIAISMIIPETACPDSDQTSLIKIKKTLYLVDPSLRSKLILATLEGDEVSMLTHTYHTNLWGRLKWPYATTRLTIYFVCGLMSNVVICKLETCGHTWHQMSLLRPGVVKQCKPVNQTIHHLVWVVR